uniref:LRRCT domain-containing protein n=2 Tax=Meloidogyne incognita group TaxID=654580 RepID=A0A915LRL3_MELJA
MNTKLLISLILSLFVFVKNDSNWRDSWEDSSFEDEDYDPESKTQAKKSVCECIRGGNQTLKCGAQGLNNANLIVPKEIGSIAIAHLERNYISYLFKNKILPGQEKSLLSLDLSQNRIADIEPGSLDNFVNLLELKLTQNNLDELSDNLRALSLSGNPLRSIPKAISPEKLPKLEILVMSDTYLEALNKGELAAAAPKLKKFYMQKSRYLKRIDNCAFCGLKQLESNLDITNSKGTKKNANAFGKSPPKELKQINLKNCNFTNLHEGTLKNVYWSTMQRLRLEGNPWNCDCELKWLMQNENAMRTAAEFEIPKFVLFEKTVKGLGLYEAQAKIECGPPLKSTSPMAKTMVIMVFMLLSTVLLVFGVLYARKHFTLTGRMAPDLVGFTAGREMFSDEFDEDDGERADVVEPANTIVAVGDGANRPVYV